MSRGVRTVPLDRLLLSKAPAVEIAAAALVAQKDAGLARAAFVVVAVDPDELEQVSRDVEVLVNGTVARRA